MKKYVLLFLVIFFTISCSKKTKKYESDNLKIYQISESVYVHTSYLSTKKYGKVACNGMIVYNKEEAIVFDTPTNNLASFELIYWINNSLNAGVKYVIPTHFHADCLGGLETFQNKYIHCLVLDKTRELANISSAIYKSDTVLTVGSLKVSTSFFGKGHTSDNTVAYVHKDNVLFGGCLVKSLKASKGNLNDADTLAWSNTVQKIKNTYPKLSQVIPGHGEVGDSALLDYTIELFKTERNE